MKFIVLLLVAFALCQAAPVEEKEEEVSTKSKRGLHLGLGYHAPLITHSYVAPAPVYHAAPIYHHAPIIAHAAPLISHPILPAYHSFHHI